MVIEAAKKAGWLTTQRADHMGFGVILGENKKKFSTRKGASVKLLDLIN
jgi:arginyl-tRNA synthetase